MQGMNRDLAVSRFSPSLVYDARNIRITANNGKNSLLSITNEKGTSEVTITPRGEGDTPILGTIIGTAVLKDTLVLFTTSSGTDRIYKIVFTNSYQTATCYKLFQGQLQFDATKPLETLPIYETEDIQKVYWVDGINQPRVINIANDSSLITNGDIFNFNRMIGADYQMRVTKYNSGGEFPAGTIQYCFNYFNKFGQETNIVDVSPLYYLCPKDKGLPADAMSTASFLIKITGLDTSYDYVRLYSIIRTSENAVPNVRIVGDFRISEQLVGQRENQATTVVVSDENLYWVSYDLSQKVLFTDFYTGAWNEGAPTLIDIQGGYVYDESTGYYYSDYYLNIEPPAKISQIVLQKGSGTISILSNPAPFYLRAGLIRVDYGNVNGITVTDTGLMGSTIDASALLFIGGQDIIAGTLANKDTTLFLGNIKQNVPNIGNLSVGLSSVAEEAKGTASACAFSSLGTEKISFVEGVEEPDVIAGPDFYTQPINNNRSSYDTKFFKARENYRLGFIAQYNTGQWSEVVWIDDLDETLTPGTMVFYNDSYNNRKWGPGYRKPGFKAVLPIGVVNALVNAGFIRVAPVVVYPEFSDRKVLFQGLLAGTVYNVDDRNNNSPFVQADWRFRVGYDDTGINGEIQCNTYSGVPHYPAVTSGGNQLTADAFVNYYANQYYRDSSILSFHSPDVEEDEGIIQADLSDVKLRIVGISNLGFRDNGDNTYSGQIPEIVADSLLTITTQGFSADYSGIKDFSFFSGTTRKNPRNVQQVTEHIGDLAFNGYQDCAVLEKTDGDDKGKIITPTGDEEKIYRWVTYLWHRNGSLNNQPALSADALHYGSIRYAMLGKKCISEIRYARTTFFQNVNSFGPESVDLDINTPAIFDSNELSTSKISAWNKSGILYYGNINKVIVPNFKDIMNITCSVDSSHPANISSSGYPIEYESVVNLGDPAEASANNTNTNSGRPQRQGGSVVSYISRANSAASGYGKDPVLMKYKSTKHIVVGINSATDNMIYQLAPLPEGASTLTYPAFWDNNASVTRYDLMKSILDDSVYSDATATFTGLRNVVYVAEFYRQFSGDRLDSRFGGKTQEAIVNNVWTRCGESVKLVSDEAAVMYYKEGDTYLGRYDCLKTYPFTDEDQNQIVSIYSTEIESRVNLDARYDKNRGSSSNMYMRPTNFNLYNHPGYEQKNQYFTYKAIDYDRYKSLQYPNMLTWSLEKKTGADIDAWTSIPMTSTADARGDLGAINAITTFGDTLYLFQNKGVAQVLFNERVQIPTGDGQPIEITNGMKYQGIRYISNQIGLSNKWSLCETPYGMYFVDDEKNTLYKFTGQQFDDLSTKQGFRTWLSDNNSYKVWNPVNYDNVRTFYDKVNGDLYFMTKTESLVYSEQLGVFTSFMDYAKLPYLANVNDLLLTATENSSHQDTIHKLFGGEYNKFFGSYKDFWITFVSNSDPTIDKVYDNLAWRSMDYDGTGILQPLVTFDTLRVWNDHQDTGNISLVDVPGKPSSLKKKFNVFRALVPRDSVLTYHNKGLNRIRNSWAYIKLMKDNTSAGAVNKNHLLQFSDLDVDFFE